MSNTIQNSTDATMGQSLRARIEARKMELEAAVGELPQDDQTRKDIEAALNQVSGLMTGDLDKIPQVVAAELSRWLEAHKHLDERAAKAAPAKTAETPSKAEPGADEQPAEDEPGADEQPDATLEPAATVGHLPS